MDRSGGRTEFAVFCHNLVFLRRQHGYSKKRMAKILGIGIRTLDRLERGEMPPRLGTNILAAVHAYFGITPSRQFTEWLDS